MSNAFAAFLSDSDSESGAPKKTKPTQKAAVPAATAEKPKARTTESKPVKAPVATQKKDTNVKPTELSKQKLERNPNREKSSPQAPAAFGEDGVKQSTQRQTSFRERGRGGRGGGRGEGRGGFRGGKREFDRHSGTGRGREMKKQGAGAHNWGDAAGEIQAIAKADLSKLDAVEPSTSIEEKAETTVDGAAPIVSSGEGEKTDVAPEVEEPPELTYEDFMKLKAEKRAGAGFEELKNAKVEGIAEGRVYAKKGEEVSDATAAAKEKAKKDKKQKEKVMVEVGFKFGGESDQGRGGYRGRGRGRGRGGERREFSERAGEPREFPERNGERREFTDRGGFRGARGGSSWERGGYRGRGRGAAAGSSPVVTNDEANFPDLA